jgi:hypothetical protein
MTILSLSDLPTLSEHLRHADIVDARAAAARRLLAWHRKADAQAAMLDALRTPVAGWSECGRLVVDESGRCEVTL